MDVLVKDSKAPVRLREAWPAGTIGTTFGLNTEGDRSTDIHHHWTESSPCSFMDLQQTRFPDVAETAFQDELR